MSSNEIKDRCFNPFNSHGKKRKGLRRVSDLVLKKFPSLDENNLICSPCRNRIEKEAGNCRFYSIGNFISHIKSKYSILSADLKVISDSSDSNIYTDSCSDFDEESDVSVRNSIFYH